MLFEDERRISEYIKTHDESYGTIAKNLNLSRSAVYLWAKANGYLSPQAKKRRIFEAKEEKVESISTREIMISYDKKKILKIDYTKLSVSPFSYKRRRFITKDNIAKEILTIVIGEGYRRCYIKCNGKLSQNNVIKVVNDLVMKNDIKLVLCDNEFAFLRCLGIRVAKGEKGEFAGSGMAQFQAGIKKEAYARIHLMMNKNNITYETLLSDYQDMVAKTYVDVLEGYGYREIFY